MAQSRSLLDPFDLLRTLAAHLEKRLEKAADRGVRSTGFTRAMHQALGTSLLARRLASQLQDGLLGALNLPTRDDVLHLGERLQALDDRIIALSAELATRDGAGPALKHAAPVLRSPPRTKKPPASPPPDLPSRPSRRKVRP